MSKATKRKHVFSELQDLRLPLPTQEIVRVLSSRGNNLHEVESADGNTFLVSMPTKFRKNVWVKRGDYLLVDPIEEGDKVKAEMNTVLTANYVKYLKSENVWPEGFSNDDVDVESNDEIYENLNRPPNVRRDSSSSEESETD